jgi:hypothetical protein
VGRYAALSLGFGIPQPLVISRVAALLPRLAMRLLSHSHRLYQTQRGSGRLGLAGSCHAAYLKANPKVRRRFNQAVLKAVYIEDGKVMRAEYTDVFAALFSRPSSFQSSNKWIKVPPARIELKGCRPAPVEIRASYAVD